MRMFDDDGNDGDSWNFTLTQAEAEHERAQAAKAHRVAVAEREAWAREAEARKPKPFRTTGTQLPPHAEWAAPGVMVQNVGRRAWVVKTFRTGSTGARLEPGRFRSRDVALAVARTVWLAAGG